jgi:carboxypeptidase family protein
MGMRLGLLVLAVGVAHCARSGPVPRGAPPRVPPCLSGKVRSLDGQVVAGAMVCAWTGVPWTPRSVCAQTGAEGAYELCAAPSGQVVITATAPGFRPGAYVDPVTGRPSIRLAAHAIAHVDIALARGGTAIRGVVRNVRRGVVPGALVESRGSNVPAATRADERGEFAIWVGDAVGQAICAWADGFAKQCASAPVAADGVEIVLLPDTVLVGCVLDANGRPVAGAAVSVTGGLGSTGDEKSWLGLADTEGRFRIGDLAPGRYRPFARTKDAIGIADRSLVLGLGRTSDEVRIVVYPSSQPLPPVPGREEPEDVSGWPVIQGVVLDDDGRGAVAASVSAEYLQGPVFDTVTASDGRFRLPVPLPATYEIQALLPGHPRAQPTRVTVPRQGTRDLTLRLERGATIRGRVLDEAGRPRNGVEVNVHGAPGSYAARSQRDGSFAVRGLKPGAYTVAPAPEPRYHDAVQSVTLQADEEFDVTITLPTESLRTIRGVVRDADGRPAPDVRIGLEIEEMPFPVYTDADGRFVLDGLLPGRHTVTAHAPGGEKAHRTYEGADPLDLRLSRVVSISGRVCVVGQDRPPQAFAVGMRWGADRGEWFFHTDGRWTMDGLPEGETTVYSHADEGDFKLVEHRIRIRASEPLTNVVLPMLAKGTPEDAVDERCTPQPVWCETWEGGWMVVGWSRDGRRVAIEHLTPQCYRCGDHPEPASVSLHDATTGALIERRPTSKPCGTGENKLEPTCRWLRKVAPVAPQFQAAGGNPGRSKVSDGWLGGVLGGQGRIAAIRTPNGSGALLTHEGVEATRDDWKSSAAIIFARSPDGRRIVAFPGRYPTSCGEPWFLDAADLDTRVDKDAHAQ